MRPEDFNRPLPECQPIQGFVVLLDALGAKAFSKHEIQQFVESHRLIVRVLQEVLPGLRARHAEADGTSRSEASKVLTFGDTVAILWPATSSETASWMRELQEVSAATAYIMALAFISGLQLRGAFSVGEFYIESDIAIGPAVADAAEWYEQPQLIGVMATPGTRRILSETLSLSLPVASQARSIGETLDHLERDLTSLFWPEFALPLKNGSSSQQTCLNWPYALFTLGPEITESAREHVSEFFRRKLAARSRPPSAQPKYLNTERFFDHCVSHIEAAEKHSFHLKIERALTTGIPIEWLSAFLHRYK